MNYSNDPVPSIAFNTAVLFMVFNRPDTTRKVFEAIRLARPLRLYVAADGPRADRVGEVEQVKMVREIVSCVDWPCEVKTLFREKNIGCKLSISGAISWFFEHEEQGIILEDDCVPNQDFFGYCDQLLRRYKEDERVWAITGDNLQDGKVWGDGSYYFSKYFHCWGWATWRRAWNNFEIDIPWWPTWSRSMDFYEKMPDRVEQLFWQKTIDSVFSGKLDTCWDYQWCACIWRAGGLTATPNSNLVSNIGFGSDATHTFSANSPLAAMGVASIGAIVHPNKVEAERIADKYVFDYRYGGKYERFPFILFYLPKRFLGILRRKIINYFCV